MEDGFTAKTPGVVPVPVSGTDRVGALEVTESVPFALPPAVGAKVTLKEKLWPALKVTGGVIPLVL
jgi:hypothetical protein